MVVTANLYLCSAQNKIITMATFQDYELRLLQPSFDSKLVGLIVSLEELRKKRVELTTRPELFLGVKRLFHSVESIGSARIEGNHTTIADYVESQRGVPTSATEADLQEIENIEHTLRFIEETIEEVPITKNYLLELHKRVVSGLPTGRGQGGDHTPGAFRSGQAVITESEHLPPSPMAVDGYMDELIDFVTREDDPRYDLIKIALAHHRFVWIHPFTNGNGRTVRLFTYALLMKYGFRVETAQRILNPTAVFCNDREAYYNMLMEVDTGTDAGLEAWCEYVLGGLKVELEKVDHLAQHSYLSKKILHPAIDMALRDGRLSRDDARVLHEAVELQIFQNSDLKKLFPQHSPSSISKKIRQLIEQRLLIQAPDSQRKYILRLTQNILTSYIMQQLSQAGFLPQIR